MKDPEGRSGGVHAASEVDPRLVALGLVPPPVEAPPEPPPAPAPPAAEQPRSAASARPLPVAARPTPQPAPPVFAPPVFAPPVFAEPAAPAITLYSHPVRVGRRSDTLELRTDGAQLVKTKHAAQWHEIKSVTAHRGAVRVQLAKTRFAFVPEIDGVPERSLAPLFAEMVLDASSGTPPRAHLQQSLRDTVAQLHNAFREDDDPFLPLFAVLPMILCAVLLSAILPSLAIIPFRGGTLAAGAFLLYPRITPFEPYVVMAALLGGAVAGALVFRLAAGRDVTQWARGILRGWHPSSRKLGGLFRRTVATLLVRRRLFAVGFVFAMLLLPPFARERVLIDDAGLHVRGALPFLDHEIPWAEVDSALLLSEPKGYGVLIRARDGTVVTTRGHVFFGLSEYELHEYAQRQLAQR